HKAAALERADGLWREPQHILFAFEHDPNTGHCTGHKFLAFGIFDMESSSAILFLNRTAATRAVGCRHPTDDRGHDHIGPREQRDLDWLALGQLAHLLAAHLDGDL